MHPQFIHQMDEAVAEVFALMLGQSCAPVDSDMGCPGLGGEPPTLTATILFSGALEGACAIHLQHRTAAQLACELTGLAAHDLPNDLPADTAGELCNMIAGSWKSRQPPYHSACALSVPAITFDAPRRSPRLLHTLVRLYRFAHHTLALELTFD